MSSRPRSPEDDLGTGAETLVADAPSRAPTTILEEGTCEGCPAPMQLQSGGHFEGFRVLAPMPVTSAEADLWMLQEPQTGVRRVLKLYRYGVRPKREILERVATLQTRHIVRVVRVGEVAERVYEIQEYVEGGSLADRMRAGNLGPDLIRVVLRQITEALMRLQEYSVLHRDVKPANILIRCVDPMELVLSDFGISSVGDISLHLTTVNRTPAYCAPEATTGVVSKASDWWSVGVMVLEMLTGKHPFSGMSEQAINFRLMSEGIEVPRTLPTEWVTLLRGLLTRNYRHRWMGAEVERWMEGDRTIGVYAEVASGERSGAGHKPYRFETRECGTAEALAEALARNWSEAQRHWSLGYLLRWVEVELRDQRLAGLLREIHNDGRLGADQKLSAVLLALHPDLPLAVQGIVLDEQTCQANPNLAESIALGSLGDWLMRCRSDPWLKQWSEEYCRAHGAFADREGVDQRVLRAHLCAPLTELREAARRRVEAFTTARDSRLAVLMSAEVWSRVEAIELLIAQRSQYLSGAEADVELRWRQVQAKGWYLDETLARKLLRDPSIAKLEPYWRRLADHWVDRQRTPIRLSHEGLRERLRVYPVDTLDAVGVVSNRLDYENTVGQRFVPILGTRTFWSVWLTRVRDFAAFVEAGGWPLKAPSFEQGEDHPIVMVTVPQAEAYCDWLTRLERAYGRIGPRDFYRLPTDREWSRVVGLGHEPGGSPRERNGAIGGIYPWGTEFPPPKGVANLGEELGVDSYPFTSPVGLFPSNEHGLYDLGSNVSEWCSDWYDEDIGLNVIRGAAWSHGTREACLSSARRRLNGTETSDNVGFRCVLEYKVPPPVGLDGYGGVAGVGEASPWVEDGNVGLRDSSLGGGGEEAKTEPGPGAGTETGVRKPFWKIF